MAIDRPRATPASRRLRSWRRRALAAVLLATASAIILTCTTPYLFFSPPPTLLSFHPPFNSSRDPHRRVSLPVPLVSIPKPLSPPPAKSSDVKLGGNDHLKIRCSLVADLPAMSPDEQLLYARIEIENAENAPLASEDADELYAPLFRNVSVFRRSYELMEKILKVYIYPDGSRPIFHTPNLRGIYASEGWFLKLMEENKKFVVKDPRKAHLFYLPYSSRQLELAIYVPESHDLKPLSHFLKDYVNNISAKYPFWNRTKGADHFLVACHDWGPYTTTAHQELRKNTMKALCNADVSEGIFVRGKDVSLPETTIRTPKRPLRFLGGRPVSQRSILAFFAGNMHGRVRPILLKYWEKDKDMKIYGPLPNRVAREMSYIHHMKTSRFCICPMGYEVNSPRIVEAIYYECVPVIIADNFVPPLDEVLDWSAFSVIIAEKDIPNLKTILLSISLRNYVSMHNNVKRLQKHFLWHNKPEKYDLFHMILHSLWFNRLNQVQVHQ
ncbi:hypothetical protein J5N97_004180 [Dioscorea zingiberensis]|uniref:Exostosin GT47 domain-containing protein n=1 Tax=Dioscorea zingiberensis TaxID=325984 RepID=A0A9D5D7E2_9LILI|nr:hypothetical protein J5N97_004180 [Dioscorea zingiberensis]